MLGPHGPEQEDDRLFGMKEHLSHEESENDGRETECNIPSFPIDEQESHGATEGGYQ